MDLTEYLESNLEPSTEKFLNVKTRVKSLLSQREPDMDVSDNSVVGDLILNRFCKVLAIAEEAQACLLSDVQISNILNGNICDCDFAEAFIKSLGFANILNANTTGVVRITFNATKLNPASTYSIDAGSSLAFNDAYMFRFYAPKKGSINIKFPQADKSFYEYSGPNTDFAYNIFYAGILEVIANDSSATDKDRWIPSLYFIDLPVYGPSNASIEAGSNPTTDISDPQGYISSIELLNDIVPFETPTSIVQLAKLAQKLYPSSNFSTKGGVVSYLTKEFPNINCFTPLTQNDDTGRQHIILDNYKQSVLDIYTKTGNPNNLITVTQNIPAAYMNNVNLIAPATSITSASYTYRTGTIADTNPSYKTVELDVTNTHGKDVAFLDTTVHIGDTFSNIASLPGVESLNSIFAKFISLNVFDKGYKNAPINIQTYDQFKLCYVTITYTYDPATLFVGSLVNSNACTPFLDTQVRSYIDLFLGQLVLKYNRQSSSYVDRQQIRQDVFTLMNEIVSPLVYNVGYLTSILINNGALSLNNVLSLGFLKVCPYTSVCLTYQNNVKFAGDICKDMQPTPTLENIKGEFTISDALPATYANNNTMKSVYNSKIKVDNSNLGYTLPLENISLVESTTTII